jgi:anhydro-N-acetylmuramic acid kinase
MAALAAELGAPVAPVESVGWNGDMLEAQCFAYLAVRSLRGLPLSLPTTTGVPRPMTGGELSRAPRRAA